VHDLIDVHLDHSATRTQQTSEKIHIVYDKVLGSNMVVTISYSLQIQAMLRFPYLNDIGAPYDSWVIKDFITLRLKHLQTLSGKKKGGKKVRVTRQSGND
jgi:hypothetical protein